MYSLNPESGWVNLGSYRSQVYDRNHVGLHTVADVLAFLDKVAIAPCYGARTNLPLASLNSIAESPDAL